jgi:hypothetical protein
MPVHRTREPFSHAEALSFAVERLKLSQSLRHERAPKTGDRVVCCVVPLHLAPTLNVFAEMPGYKRRKLKRECESYVFGQAGQHARTVGGTPTVIMVRFSSAHRIDHDAAWTKLPLDRLTDLGWIGDDSTKAINLVTWHEQCPPGKGFVYVEVWHE